MSRLILSKFKPAFCKSGRILDNVTPFVVIAISCKSGNSRSLSAEIN